MSEKIVYAVSRCRDFCSTGLLGPQIGELFLCRGNPVNFKHHWNPAFSIIQRGGGLRFPDVAVRFPPCWTDRPLLPPH